MYIIRNGHLEVIEKDEFRTKYHYVEDPDTHYYVYPLTQQGIRDFIFREDIEICDEYGELQNKDEFFKYALEVSFRDAYDAKSYAEEEISKNPNYRNFISTDNEYIKALCKEGFNIKWPYSDFYSDGLRFATFNNFS